MGVPLYNLVKLEQIFLPWRRAMDNRKTVLGALSILVALLFSFIFPAYFIPLLDQRFNLTDSHQDLIRSLLTALPLFIGLFASFLYSNSDRIYLFGNRLWLQLSNSAVSWSLTVNYRENIEVAAFDAVFRSLLKTYEDEAEVLKNEPLEKLVNLPRSIGGVAHLHYVETAEVEHYLEGTTELRFRILNLSVPFRKSEKILESLDALLVDTVEKNLNVQNAKYTFQINFDESNPYLGLFLRQQRVRSQDLRSFSCGFVDHNGPSIANVEVNKKRLAVVTSSAGDLRRLSKRYVALAAMPTTSVT